MLRGGGDTPSARVNVTYNMIKILPLASPYLWKRTEKSVGRWKHDRMLFSKGQRGVENVSGRLRATLVQADAASEGTLAYGAAFVLPGEKLNQILFWHRVVGLGERLSVRRSPELRSRRKRKAE